VCMCVCVCVASCVVLCGVVLVVCVCVCVCVCVYVSSYRVVWSCSCCVFVCRRVVCYVVLFLLCVCVCDLFPFLHTRILNKRARLRPKRSTEYSQRLVNDSLVGEGSPGTFRERSGRDAGEGRDAVRSLKNKIKKIERVRENPRGAGGVAPPPLSHTTHTRTHMYIYIYTHTHTCIYIYTQG